MNHNVEFSTAAKKVLVHTCSLCSKNRTVIILYTYNMLHTEQSDFPLVA
jgi:hypothetical protein